jgi:hypothetical protein
MRYTNFLAKMLDWLREVFEHASPSVFSLFAALLPYLSPLPVAVMTAESSETYLGFTPQVAGVFVFVLEGLGLWTTTMLVDSVVDFIRSRNWKNVFNIVIFLCVVVIYVFILINLNVSLEITSGNSDPIYSRILTLICFLPLISGVMNGYWKLKLEHKTEMAEQRALEELHYQQARADKKERWKVKHELSNGNGNLPESPKKVSTPQESFQKVSSWRKVKGKLSRKDLERLANATPEQMQQWAAETGMTYKTISNWRTNAKNELQGD